MSHPFQDSFEEIFHKHTAKCSQRNASKTLAINIIFLLELPVSVLFTIVILHPYLHFFMADGTDGDSAPIKLITSQPHQSELVEGCLGREVNQMF